MSVRGRALTRTSGTRTATAMPICHARPRTFTHAPAASLATVLAAASDQTECVRTLTERSKRCARVYRKHATLTVPTPGHVVNLSTWPVIFGRIVCMSHLHYLHTVCTILATAVATLCVQYESSIIRAHTHTHTLRNKRGRLPTSGRQ